MAGTIGSLLRLVCSRLALLATCAFAVIVATLLTRSLLPQEPLGLSQLGFRERANVKTTHSLQHSAEDEARLLRLVGGSVSQDANQHGADGRRSSPLPRLASKLSADLRPTYYPVTSDTPLLLPVLPFGPNNQFRGLRDALVLARWLNRTLVVPPFYKHYTATVDAQLPVEADEIFDWDQLASLQPTVHWSVWKRLCGGGIDVILRFSTFTLRGQYARIRRAFEHVGITVEYGSTDLLRQPEEVASSSPVLRTALEAQERFPSRRHCAVAIFPYKRIDISHDAIPLALHLRRSKRLRHLAAHFTATKMSDGAAAVLHWRYNNDWSGSWCHQPYTGSYNESKVRDPNYRSICRSVISVNISHVPDVLNKLIDQRKIRHIYVATPVSDFAPLMVQLRAKLHHMLSSQDLLSVAGEDSATLRRASIVPIKSNFELSIVEQELAATASTFIGSKVSTWSSNVAFERKGLFNRVKAFAEPVIWINDLLNTAGT